MKNYKIGVVALLFIGAGIRSQAETTPTLESQIDKDGKWTEFSFVLKPSKLGGVGVFATHDIPSGTLLFNQEIKQVGRILKIKDVPAELIKYCVYINDEECFCPERFDRMEIGWYVNHSLDPNISKKNSPRTVKTVDDFYDNREEHEVYAIKDIKAGDEILMDYNELNEPEQLKEDFYTRSI